VLDYLDMLSKVSHCSQMQNYSNAQPDSCKETGIRWWNAFTWIGLRAYFDKHCCFPRRCFSNNNGYRIKAKLYLFSRRKLYCSTFTLHKM